MCINVLCRLVYCSCRSLIYLDLYSTVQHNDDQMKTWHFSLDWDFCHENFMRYILIYRYSLVIDGGRWRIRTCSKGEAVGQPVIKILIISERIHHNLSSWHEAAWCISEPVGLTYLYQLIMVHPDIRLNWTSTLSGSAVVGLCWSWSRMCIVIFMFAVYDW